MHSSQTGFDIDAWTQRLRLEEPQIWKLAGGAEWPPGVVATELLRRMVLGDSQVGDWIDTDVFVFGLGPSPSPRATKIGGAPFRPRTLAWPTDQHGDQLTFVAQLDFSHSRDVTGDVPGDLLLIFAEDGIAFPEEGNALHFAVGAIRGRLHSHTRHVSRWLIT